MREIKFKAWDNKNKKWLSAVSSLEYLLDDSDAAVSHHDIDEESALYIYPNNLLGDNFGGRIKYVQYIGIKDTNQKEIYEGDIIEYDETDIGGFHGLGIVEYNINLMFSGAPNFGVWSYKLLSNINLKEGQSGIGWSSFPFNVKIIGNVFEHQDLLDDLNKKRFT